ncbi:MotE family protein [Sulfitobacter pacificus]|uniref:MotE family protein n=1 Tax=Sulfitobacter pacificus TaxID=1499314 RepID=UPI003107A4F4
MKKKTRKFRRAGRGAILLLTVLLVSSAILRVGSGTGKAFAEAMKPAPVEAEVQSEETKNAPQGIADISTDRAEVGKLLKALRAREVRVKELENQIAMRSKALAVADQEITKRLAVLEQAEENLRQTIALADGAAEDDLTRLTTVYESMKPKDAAKLFEAMEPKFAAGFLGRMRPDAAAAIMAGLTPERAYSISAILAGRNATVPKT